MRIALVDTSILDSNLEQQPIIPDANSSVTLEAIRQVIAECNGHEVFAVPDNQDGSAGINLDQLVESSTAQLDAIKPDVIFISSYTAYAGLALNLGRMWQEQFDSRIVHGGRHFEESGLKDAPGIGEKVTPYSQIRQPITTSLVWGRDNGGVDFVYSGPGGDIPQLLRILEGKHTNGAEGVFHIEGDTIFGFGRGSKISEHIIPTTVYRYANSDLTGVSSIVSNTCPERCDYCNSASSIGTNFDDLRISRATEAISEKMNGDQGVLGLMDCNPLRPDVLDKYARLIEGIKNRGKKIFSMFYMDPAYMIDDTFFDRACHFMRDANVGLLFIGRDCVTEEMAAYIGRNYKGKPRSQEMLDAEGRTIRNLTFRFGADTNRVVDKNMVVSYILAPHVSSIEYLGRLMDDIYQTAYNAVLSGVRMKIRVGMLEPYVGTKFGETSRDYFDRLENHVTGRTPEFWLAHDSAMNACIAVANSVEAINVLCKETMAGKGEEDMKRVQVFVDIGVDRPPNNSILYAHPSMDTVTKTGYQLKRAL